VEEDYKHVLDGAKSPKEMLDLAKVIAIDAWTKKISNFSNSKEQAEKEIESLNNQINTYVDLIPTTKSENIKVRYEDKIEGLDNKIKELEKGLKNKKEPNCEEALDLTLKFLGTPGEYWENADPETRILIHRLVFPENPAYSFQNGFGTPKLSVPFYLKHYIADSKSTMVVCFV
jgi:seryl-tRNA synthetase